MKKLIFILLAFTEVITAQAQYEKDEEKKGGFKKENFFTGGSVTASFFNGGTVLGISPYFGYSVNRFVDVAVSANYNYASQRDNVVYGDKLRQTIAGPGAFVRLFPVRFLFAQAQYEYNFIRQKYIALPNSGYQNTTERVKASSALVGGGYCSGREDVGDVFYYLSVMWDLKKDVNSPYTDGLNRALPIVRAGLQIPLFQGGRRRF